MLLTDIKEKRDHITFAGKISSSESFLCRCVEQREKVLSIEPFSFNIIEIDCKKSN